MPGELVQGLRSLDEGFVPPVFDPSVLDDRLLVTGRDAIIGLRLLLREEGIFAGLSSGAAISVALTVARQMTRGTVVVLLADGGWKYLSADLWTRDLDGSAMSSKAPCCGERTAAPWPDAAGPCGAGDARPCRAELPHEACGLVSGTLETGLAVAYHPARNSEHSPLRYNVHPDDLLRITLEIEAAGPDLVGIFHSHTHTPPAPSATDLRAAMYSDPFYILATLADPDATPEDRCAPGGSATAGAPRGVPLDRG